MAVLRIEDPKAQSIKITAQNEDETFEEKFFTLEDLRCETKEQSTSVRLLSLSIGDSTFAPEFDPDVLKYAMNTSESSDVIMAIPEALSAKVEISNEALSIENGSAGAWHDGIQWVTVTVTNSSESREYKVLVAKEALLPYDTSWTRPELVNGMLMSMGPSGKLLILEDGVWTDYSMPSEALWTTPIFGDNDGVYVSLEIGGNKAAWSEDAKVWNVENLPISGTWLRPGYINGEYVSVDFAVGSSGVIYTKDLKIWNSTYPSYGIVRPWLPIYFNGYYLLENQGSNEYFKEAADLGSVTSWSGHTNGKPSSITYWNAMIFKPGTEKYFMAFLPRDGKEGRYTERSKPTLSSFTQFTLPYTGTWNQPAYGNGRYLSTVYVTTSAGSTYAAYSTNGIYWVAAPMPTAKSKRNPPIFINGFFLSTNEKDTDADYSFDGIKWESFELPFYGVNTVPSSCGDDFYVSITVEDSVTKVAYSVDCLNWVKSFKTPEDGV